MPALFQSTSTSHDCAYATSYGSHKSSFSTRRCVRPSAFAFSRNGVTCGENCTVAMTLCPFLAKPIAAASPKPEPAPVIRMVFDMTALSARVEGSDSRQGDFEILRHGAARYADGPHRFTLAAIQWHASGE